MSKRSIPLSPRQPAKRSSTLTTTPAEEVSSPTVFQPRSSTPASRATPSSSPMKYIVVTGGILSGLGKGITASSISVLLQGCGWRVNMIKIDPYLNVDAGTMSPYEHGETFVLDDGGETDLDLGNYERFLDIRLKSNNNITTGKVYQSVINKERQGKYLGKTVQVVPHIVEEIMEWLETVSHQPLDEDGHEADVCVVELGGTVGDIESMPFIEALRQLQYRVGADNFCCVQVTLVPQVSDSSEQKTKPTQHAVKELRSSGLAPEIICCRCSTPLKESARRKLALFCQVPDSHVISVHDVSNIYAVPLLLEHQGIASIIGEKLGMYVPKGMPRIPQWRALVGRMENATQIVKIAVIGKYTAGSDAYLSVVRSLQHASAAVDRKLEILWVEASDLEDCADGATRKNCWGMVKSANGILVPGGFGERGIDGMVRAVQYARTSKIPFLGICLGLQVAVIEACRNQLNMPGANSEEFNREAEPKAVVFMPEGSKTHMGGTMRLGSRETVLTDAPCIARTLYAGQNSVFERHRHRYEVNPDLVSQIETCGLRFTGKDTLGERMEIVEMPKDMHPFFLACQYHPEFQSRVLRPSPPFLGLLQASTGKDVQPTAKA